MVCQFLKVALVFCFLTATVAGSPFEDRSVGDIEFRANGNTYRLPNNTKPEHYDISLMTRIDQASFDFSGIVRIDFVVLSNTREITLHARQLTVKDIRLLNGTQAIPLLSYSYNVVMDFLMIPTDNVDLLEGKRYTLDIQYEGILRKDNAGFYRSSYINTYGTRT